MFIIKTLFDTILRVWSFAIKIMSCIKYKVQK